MIEYIVKQRDYATLTSGEKYRLLVACNAPDYSVAFLVVDAATWAAFRVGDKINIAVSAAVAAETVEEG